MSDRAPLAGEHVPTPEVATFLGAMRAREKASRKNRVILAAAAVLIVLSSIGTDTYVALNSNDTNGVVHKIRSTQQAHSVVEACQNKSFNAATYDIRRFVAGDRNPADFKRGPGKC